jgi:hypothetical protein
VGLLPEVAFESGSGIDNRIALSSYPNPEELLLMKRAAEAKRAALDARLASFSPRNRAVTTLVLLGVPQFEVAQAYGVTAPRIFQLVRALRLGLTQYEIKKRRRRRKAVVPCAPHS